MITVWTVAMVHPTRIEVYSHVADGEDTIWQEDTIQRADLPTWYDLANQDHAFQVVSIQAIEVAATQDAGIVPLGYQFSTLTERLWVLTTEFDGPARLIRISSNTVLDTSTGEGHYPSDFDPNL